MKRTYITVLVSAFVLILSGCNKWLDISPVDEVSEAEMFSKTEGFYNVLNGIYLDLGTSSLYGKKMTWGAMEAWGRGYALKKTVDAHDALLSLQNFEYESKDPKSDGETIWIQLYKNIARVNMLIQNGETKPDDFFKHGTVEKRLILGEAHALRAYMHFDLLRVFGQTLATPEGRDGSYIPYVTTYPSKVNPPLPSSEVIGKVREDLEVAADLVAAYDTLHMADITSYESRFSSSSRSEWGKFYTERGCRLNYYAILLLQARAALYDGDHEAAISYAGVFKELVDEREMSFESSLSTNPKLMKETLFAFYNPHLLEESQDWFKDPYSSTSRALKVEHPALYSKISQDKRKSFLESGMLPVILIKDKTETYMPSLRLAEAYYILAESLASTGKLVEGIQVFNYFLGKRGMNSSKTRFPENGTYEEFIDYMVDDFRKEYTCMGQTVFMYKRLNIPVRYSGGEDKSSVGNLVFPIPHSESVTL